jgi:tRNA(Ile2) C34 agmatinyltransferase TiaS
MTDPQTKSGNPHCPACGVTLSGDALKDLRCPDCGEELPPRLGI